MKLAHIHNCESPRLVRNKYTHELVETPCGCCPSCLLRRNTRYIAPILNESSCSKYQIFFTLTYSNEFLPKCDLKTYLPDDKYKTRYYNLYDESIKYIRFCNFLLPFCCVSDVQKFIKRLREQIYRQFQLRRAIRYFIAPDYGCNGFRPHWHGLLFFSDERILENIKVLILEAWSVKNSGLRKSIGRIDVQLAYAAAKYVSCYVNATVDRPSILTFRDFSPRPIFSSSPSFGSLVSRLETDKEIIERGLTQIHIYDAKTYEYRPVRLPSNLVRRLFPAIPSFSSLSRDERLHVYNIFTDWLPEHLRENAPDYSVSNRRLALRWKMLKDTFFRDYVTLNDLSLSVDQINRKLDLIYYVIKRLFISSSSFGYSIADYDLLIERYLFNCKQASLAYQFDYENDYMLRFNDSERLAFHLDLSLPVPQDYVKDTADSLYFSNNRVLFNRSIKKKLDNKYLELHPEFKQFH